jgi:Putative beta barrel porin-7 (BBP7)
VHTIIPRRAHSFVAALLLAAATTGVLSADDTITFASSPIRYVAIDQTAPVEVLPPGTIPPIPGELPSGPVVSDMSNPDASPLLDDCNEERDVMMSGNEIGDYYEGGVRRGVRPYGGGHLQDWPWGCGRSPFRNGPGMCDTYRVCGRWNVTVDGMTMKREGTDLQQIWNETDDGQFIPELFEQFDWSAGGRIEVLGKNPKCAGYQIMAAGEGIEKWEASIIYPKEFIFQEFSGQFPDITPPGTITNPEAVVYQITSQRRVHYTSNLHSGELDILHCSTPLVQPYCGIRYMRFNDQIRIVDDQEGLGPIDILDPPPIEVLTTDMTNVFNLENNLFGFQLGLRHDFWRPNSRFAIEGFVNGGVYYNKVKYANFMNTTTVQQLGNVTPVNNTEATNFTGTTNVVSTSNLAAADLAEIAYHYEASISGVCRLNKCWAMRAGYQVLWINGLRLADRAFLDPDIFLDNGTDSLFFQGWHAGIECRR